MNLAQAKISVALATVMIACGMLFPVFAQLGPVQLVEVKPLSTKRDATSGYGNQSIYTQTRALRITLRNTTAQPLTGVRVRWGVVKDRLPSGNAAIKPYTAAFGADEVVEMKPFETKTIETPPIEAHGSRWNYLPPSGERILGHGAQVMIGDKVVAEEIAPPTYKKIFEKVYPAGVDPTAPAWLQRLQDKLQR